MLCNSLLQPWAYEEHLSNKSWGITMYLPRICLQTHTPTHKSGGPPALPTPWKAQALFTPLPVALARITQEPWAGGTFSFLELKALSWVATCLPHQGGGGSPAPIPNRVKAQADGPLVQGQQQNQCHLSPAAEKKEVEA